jgi:hypothetical protein
VLLPDDWSVGIVMALIGNPDRWYLCMDRTNWKIGKSDVKILMLAVVTERYRVPLMWAFLGHPGNSTAYFARFGHRFRAILGTRFTPSWAAISRMRAG